VVRLAFDRVRVESGQIWIRVGLGHSCLGWIGSGMNRFEFSSIWIILGSGLHRVISGSGQIGSIRVQVYIGSIRFRVSSVSD